MLVLLTLQGTFDISSHFLPLSKYGKTSNHNVSWQTGFKNIGKELYLFI
jgi:hypothetical protein